MPHKLPFKIFSGEKSEYLAQKICESLDCELGKKVKTTFSDGEFAVYYDIQDYRRDAVFWLGTPRP